MSAKSTATKTIRRNIYCGYVMHGENGGDMTIYASRGTYLKKGERFLLGGLFVFECTARFKKPYSLGKWQFECNEVGKLTKHQFINRDYPPAVPGKSW